MIQMSYLGCSFVMSFFYYVRQVDLILGWCGIHGNRAGLAGSILSLSLSIAIDTAIATVILIGLLRTALVKHTWHSVGSSTDKQQTRFLIGPPEEYVHGHTLSIMLTQINSLFRYRYWPGCSFKKRHARRVAACRAQQATRCKGPASGYQGSGLCSRWPSYSRSVSARIRN